MVKKIVMNDTKLWHKMKELTNFYKIYKFIVF